MQELFSSIQFLFMLSIFHQSKRLFLRFYVLYRFIKIR